MISYNKLFNIDVEKCVVPIYLEIENHIVAVGSGFFISPGLLMTAAHIFSQMPIEELMRNKHGFREIKNLRYFFPFRIDDSNVIFRNILHIYRCDSHDISICLTDPPFYNNQQFNENCFGLSFDVAPEGSHILSLGYPNFNANKINYNSFNLNHTLHESTGFITNIYKDRRDRGMLNFPCFEFNTKILAGMSGGPILSLDSKKVIGVNCSSYPEDPELPSISFGSSLWPVLSFHIQTYTKQSPQHRVSVWEMCNTNFLNSDSSYKKFVLDLNLETLKTEIKENNNIN